MWKTFYLENSSHVVPIDDFIPHTLNVDCNCGPKLLYPDNILRHNSYDKREYFEHPPRKMEVVN